MTTKVLLGIIIVGIILPINYYFFYFKPHQEQLEIARVQALESQEAKAKQNLEQEEADRKQFSYDNCISIALDDYEAKKDTYCRNAFYNQEDNYKDCIVRKQNEHPTPIGSSMSSTDGIWRHPDGTPIANYTLQEATEICKESYDRGDNLSYNPNCTNLQIDKALEEEKDRCLQLYK